MPTEIEWSRDLVNRFWDGVENTRLAELSFARCSGADLLEFIGEFLGSGTRCLDFGAGDGSLARLLMDRGCLVAAHETSAQRRLSIQQAGLTDDANFLGFADDADRGSFDVIIASEVIEHVLDDELDSVVAKFRDYLKPGGVLVVTTPNKEDLELGGCYCPNCNSRYHRWQHVRSFTANSLNSLLAGVGFERIADHRVDFSSYGQLYEKYVELAREARHLRRIGPLYLLLKPFLKRPPNGDLRHGAQNHLIYVGRIS